MAWITEARKRCDAATPGPAIPRCEPIREPSHFIRFADDPSRPPWGGIEVTTAKALEDLRFIAGAWADLPFALAMLGEARALMTEPYIDRQRAMQDWIARLDRGPG